MPSAHAQSLSVGMAGGTVNYQGDLQESRFVSQDFHFYGGVNAHYEMDWRFAFTGEIGFGQLSGRDRLRNYARNLQFDSRLFDLTLSGRFNLFNFRDVPFVPYVSSGITVFHIDPYTADASGARVFLFPLRLEGQGLAQYPERKYQRRINIAIPMSGGVELRLTQSLKVDLEVTLRKTFTDYVDDVSTNYPDPSLLMSYTGPKAVELSYRGDELTDGSPFFPSGAQRGSPTGDDWYNALRIRIRCNIVDWALNRKQDVILFRKQGWPYQW